MTGAASSKRPPIGAGLSAGLDVVRLTPGFVATFGEASNALIGGTLSRAAEALGLVLPPSLAAGPLPTAVSLLPRANSLAGKYTWLLRQSPVASSDEAYYLEAAETTDRGTSIFTAALTQAVLDHDGRPDLSRLPGRCHFKEAQGLAYVATNAATLDLLGMSHPAELLEKSDYEVAKHQGHRWPANFADELRAIDRRVLDTGLPTLGLAQTPYYDASGKLVQHSLSKLPIYRNGQPHAVLTVAVERKALLNPMVLRRLYHRLFADQMRAHDMFVRHLGLSNRDLELPGVSPSDVDMLVQLASGTAPHHLARVTQLSSDRIAARLDALRQKLGCAANDELIDLYYSLVSDLA